MTSAATAAPATFQISVQPSGRVFSVNPGEAILAAAIRSGVGLPYGCKDGASRRRCPPMRKPPAWC